METNLTEADRRLLATAIFRSFDHWQLSETEQLALLGMSIDQVTALREMRESGLIASSQDLASRTRALLRIYRYLGMVFLQDPVAAKKWMTDPNDRLSGDSPITRIQSKSDAGIRSVATLLEEQLF